jgi:hypothetical protein
LHLLLSLQRLLDLIVPDFVHVMIEGKIVQTGTKARARAADTPRRRRPCCAASLPFASLTSFARVCAPSSGAAQELAAQLELSGYAEMGR